MKKKEKQIETTTQESTITLRRIKIDGFLTEYYINTNGDVWSQHKEKWLQPLMIGGDNSVKKYVSYILSYGGNDKKQLYAHRLVAEYYLDKPSDYQPNWEVNHKDFNRTNNNMDNLEWISKQGNMKHLWDNKREEMKKAIKEGRMRSNKTRVCKRYTIIKKTFDGKIICRYINTTDASKKEDINESSLRNRIHSGYRYMCDNSGVTYKLYQPNGEVIFECIDRKDMVEYILNSGINFSINNVVKNYTSKMFFRDRFEYGEKVYK